MLSQDKTVKGVLYRKNLDSGQELIREDVPLGKTYDVFPGSLRLLKFENTETGQSSLAVTVYVKSGNELGKALMAVELLKFDTSEVPKVEKRITPKRSEALWGFFANGGFVPFSSQKLAQCGALAFVAGLEFEDSYAIEECGPDMAISEEN